MSARMEAELMSLTNKEAEKMLVEWKMELDKRERFDEVSNLLGATQF